MSGNPKIEEIDVGESKTFTVEHKGVEYDVVVHKSEEREYKVYVKVIEFDNESGTGEKLNTDVLDTFVDELAKSFGVDVR